MAIIVSEAGYIVKGQITKCLHEPNPELGLGKQTGLIIDPKPQEIYILKREAARQLC